MFSVDLMAGKQVALGGFCLGCFILDVRISVAGDSLKYVDRGLKSQQKILKIECDDVGFLKLNKRFMREIVNISFAFEGVLVRMLKS